MGSFPETYNDLISLRLPPTNCQPFNPQYPHTNSPNWSLYISRKNKLKEFDKRLKHFLPADYFINSHNLFTSLCIDIVWEKIDCHS